MNDLISRQEAIDALERSKDKTAKGDIGGFFNTIVQNDIDTIKDLPSVLPERKTGHWILDRSGAYCCNKCMEPCATYVMMKPRDRFCKMCGADMRGEQE